MLNNFFFGGLLLSNSYVKFRITKFKAQYKKTLFIF